MTPSTHYAIRIDINLDNPEHINKIIQFFRPHLNVLIGPIEYKKNGTPHIHCSLDYDKLSVRQLDTIFRNPMKDLNLIKQGKYSFKELEITKYSNIEESYYHYLAYCMKGKEPLFSTLVPEVVAMIPKWEEKEQPDKRTFRQYVIQTYTIINPYEHYLQQDMYGDEVFNISLFQNVELNNIYNHLMKVFKHKQQLFDLGIWKKYTNLLLLTYYEKYIERRRKSFIQNYTQINQW